MWPRPDDRGPPPRPSVLLVTIDTMRADAVGPDTPAINQFLKEATRFTRVRTSVPLTLPSHLTLLSGLEPRHHGFHENLAPRLARDRGFPLLAEQFRAAGYATAAFVSSAVVGPATGIDAGFDTFESPEFVDSWSGAQGDLLASERVVAALDWIRDRDPDVPFFLWVHFYDPHVPYQVFEGDERRPATRPGDPAATLYAGEVRRADAAFERLRLAAPEGTVVVLASDHGEGLGEHGEDTHGVLCHGATLDVFLAVAAPAFPGGERADLRCLADVAPTLRGLCSLEEQPGDGLSLFEEAPPERVLVAETLWSYRTYGWAQVFAATDGRFSLVESGPRLDLFDLAHDPGEARPLEPEGHDAYERLDRGLFAYRKSARAAPEGAYFSAASPYGTAVRPLSSYLDRAENAALRDPSGGFGFRARMVAARTLIHRGKAARDAEALGQAIEILHALAQEDPKNPAPHLYLVHALGRLGWVLEQPELHRAAARSAIDAIDRGYTVAPLLHDLLYESLQAGTPEDLRAALDVAWHGGIIADLKCAELAAEAGEILREKGDEPGLALAVRFLERCDLRAQGTPDEDGFARIRARLKK